jgi:subtilisin family serine protease
LRKLAGHKTARARRARIVTGAVMNLVFVAALARAEDPGVCGPFVAGEPVSGDAATCSEAGVQPSASAPSLDGIGRLTASISGVRDAFVAGEALVAIPKGADGMLPSGLELAPGARLVGSFFSPVLCATVARIEGSPTATPESLVAKLPEGAVVVAHPEYSSAASEVRAFDPNASPDPYRAHQHALTQLDVERAWKVSGGEGTTVALLDSAPATSHSELAGVELISTEADDSALTPAPAVHGTLMAGVIGATHGNGVGISGVAPGARIVAVPVCKPQLSGGGDRCALYDVLRGIDAAWEADAQIINLSLVGPSNPLLERAVARMERLGKIVVAAAGNEGSDVPRYPAAYPSVIGVGAIDQDGERYARTNTGIGVEVYAPGVEILSTQPPNGYAFGDGTSLAAAHVSGAMAVLLGSGATPEEARAALRAGGVQSTPQLGTLCDLLAATGRSCSN